MPETTISLRECLELSREMAQEIQVSNLRMLAETPQALIAIDTTRNTVVHDDNVEGEGCRSYQFSITDVLTDDWYLIP